MNIWKCHHAGCTHTAVGIGSAFGLRAIGWQVVQRSALMGPLIKCPEHRNDVEYMAGRSGQPCAHYPSPKNPCSLCFAENWARVLQDVFVPTDPLGGISK